MGRTMDCARDCGGAWARWMLAAIGALTLAFALALGGCGSSTQDTTAPSAEAPEAQQENSDADLAATENLESAEPTAEGAMEDLSEMTSAAEMNTYAVDEIPGDGFYILNASGDKALALWNETDRTSFDEFEGKYGDPDDDYDGDPTTEPDGGYLCGAAADPFVIDVGRGEKLIYVSSYDDTPRPFFYPATFLGYGSPVLEDDFENAAEINGVDVEAAGDLASLNQQLASTNLHFYEYVHARSYSYRVLLGTKPNQEVAYGIYRGTSYEELSTTLYCPYYLALDEGHYDLDEQYEKTKNGYFVLNLGEVPAGTYYLQIMNVGDYLVQIER